MGELEIADRAEIAPSMAPSPRRSDRPITFERHIGRFCPQSGPSFTGLSSLAIYYYRSRVLSRAVDSGSRSVSVVDGVTTTQEGWSDMPLARFVVHLDADAAQLRL